MTNALLGVAFGLNAVVSVLSFLVLWKVWRSAKDAPEEQVVWDPGFDCGDFVQHRLGLFDRAIACAFDDEDGTVQVAHFKGGIYQRFWVSVFEVELLVETSELLDIKRSGG